MRLLAYSTADNLRASRKYFILWDIVNPQLGSGLGLGLGLGSGLGLGLGLDSVRGSTISHKMKYLPCQWYQPLTYVVVRFKHV